MYFSKALIIASLAAAPFAAAAQTAPAAVPVVKVGKLISTSDGRRLGRIDQIDKAKDGSLTNVELFSDMGILYIPVSTITAGADTKLVTSMTYADVTKGH